MEITLLWHKKIISKNKGIPFSMFFCKEHSSLSLVFHNCGSIFFSCNFKYVSFNKQQKIFRETLQDFVSVLIFQSKTIEETFLKDIFISR